MTEIDQVRSLVKDPEIDGQLTNDDIQTYLDINPDVLGASILAASALSAIYAQKVDIKAGPITLKNSQKAKAYTELAKSLRVAARSPGASVLGVVLTGATYSDVDAALADSDRIPSIFYSGVTDNDGEREAPRQT